MIKHSGETVETIFARLEDLLPGYEYRPQQLEFAKAIERSIESSVPGIFEAGTGTGKSLAALIPAALSGKTVVVSTATIALQEQYIHKDIPTLQRILPFQIEAALAKGRNNYVSLRRLEDFKVQSEIDSRILTWIGDSEDGDRSSSTLCPWWSSGVKSTPTPMTACEANARITRSASTLRRASEQKMPTLLWLTIRCS